MEANEERREGVMRGTITAKDVFRYGPTIVRMWGPACYLACLRAALSRRPSTFLEVLCRCGVVQPRGREA
jgi:hypothetical protein